MPKEDVIPLGETILPANPRSPLLLSFYYSSSGVITEILGPLFFNGLPIGLPLASSTFCSMVITIVYYCSLWLEKVT